MNSQKYMPGFTLVEIMIVLVVIGVLSAIAFPSYTDYMRKSKRTVAKTQMSRISQLQEQYYVENLTYGTLTNLGYASDTIGIDSDGSAVSAGLGIYDLSISPAPTAALFKLVATGKNDQLNDAGCTTLTMTSSGTQAPSSCW